MPSSLGYIKKQSKKNARRYSKALSIFSPLSLAAISYVFFLICFFLPSNIYESIIIEKNKIFLNFAAFLFVTICVVTFYMGGLYVRSVTVTGVPTYYRRRSVQVSRVLPLVVLLVGIILNIYTDWVILTQTPKLFYLLFHNASELKEVLDSSGALTQSLPLLFASCWWCSWRLKETEYNLQKKDFVIRCLLCAAIAVAIFSSVIKVARYNLIPGMFGIIFLYLLFDSIEHKHRLLYACKVIILTVVSITIVFVVLGAMRGNDTVYELFKNIFGYTVVSYNRLPGILNGDIVTPYDGSGIFTFRFLADLPLLHRWIDFGMPDPHMAFSSTFDAVYAGGLDGSYIWPSAFGRVYQDLGLASPLYFFVLGCIAMWTWNKCRIGKTVGLVLYPWFAFSILFWMGDNFVDYRRIVTFMLLSIMLTIAERIKIRKRQAC